MKLSDNLSKQLARIKEAPHLIGDLIESAGDLVEIIQYCNQEYRAGNEVVTNSFYDHVLIAELRLREPGHAFLHTVEEEGEDTFEGKKVKLPERMLSTDKAYELEEIDAWVGRIRKVAKKLGINEETLVFRLTPKLDGFAALNPKKENPKKEKSLYTRGNGYKGTEITRAFDRGLGVAYDIDGKTWSHGMGPGEIVVNKTYFERHLAQHYENSRNILSSVIKEAPLDAVIQEAIDQRKVLFYPFCYLPCKEVGIHDVSARLIELRGSLLSDIEYDVDGVVIEVTNKAIKADMGHTSSHHRWQIAYKENTEFKDVKVISITPQTSKTGRLKRVVLRRLQN